MPLKSLTINMQRDYFFSELCTSCTSLLKGIRIKFHNATLSLFAVPCKQVVRNPATILTIIDSLCYDCAFILGCSGTWASHQVERLSKRIGIKQAEELLIENILDAEAADDPCFYEDDDDVDVKVLEPSDSSISGSDSAVTDEGDDLDDVTDDDEDDDVDEVTEDDDVDEVTDDDGEQDTEDYKDVKKALFQSLESDDDDTPASPAANSSPIMPTRPVKRRLIFITDEEVLSSPVSPTNSHKVTRSE